MWVVSAPFDGAEGGKDIPRLLKTNRNYMLGRKEHALSINNKKISHDHCEFLVGDHSIDDASNPKAIPSLEVVNHLKKEKKLAIRRGDEPIVLLQKLEKFELRHGDIIALVNGIDLTIEWKPICVYSPAARRKIPISIDDCAEMGIKLVYKQHPDATHHLISHYVPNLSTAASLLSPAYFVKPEWLQEVLRLGKDDGEGDGCPLERNFVLPLETKFRPAFSPSLLPSQKKLNIWDPSEVRMKLFHECRFVCLHEKIRESDSELQEAIHRGAGTLENFDIHLGVSKFHRTLTRSHAKEGKKVVVIADADSMQAAVGKDTWQEYVDEAKTFNLNIKSPSHLVQAVLESDVQLLYSSTPADTDEGGGPSRNLSPLPDVVPSSMPEEPSMDVDESSSQATTAKPARKLVRRVTRSASREPSVAPSVASEPLDEPVRPRKPLIRRVVTTTPFITGLDDPSSVLDAPPALPRHTTPPPDIFDYTAPTPARSTRLKRRVGVAAADNQTGSMLSEIAETMEEEPPLKKFKALFDASNPDNVGSGSFTQFESQTQDDAGSPSLGQTGASSLAVFPEEEEEETQSGVPVPESQRGHKRRLEDVEDVEMDSREGSAGTAASASKRRAVEDINAVERAAPVPTQATNKPPSTLAPAAKGHGAHGAPAGQPDTDAAFLKAIASTKRGKKVEDAFDREFNQLKISKPEVETRPDPEEEWGVLAEFGDDSGLRGNFMTIVEMDLYRKDLHQKPPPNRSWDGKQNFKKFKKKITGTLRAKVDVFINDNDYGMGPAYWKGANSQPSQNQNFGSQSQPQATLDMESQDDFSAQPGGRSIHDFDDEPQPSRQKSRNPPSRGASAAPKKPLPRSKRATKGKAALFLDSDDEVHTVVKEEEQEEDETLRSLPKRPARTVKAPVKAKTLIVDDDSDDNTAFRGFRGGKGRH